MKPFECSYALVSKELIFFKRRFFQNYNLQEYTPDKDTESVIVFGFYTKEDKLKITELILSKKKVFLVWGGMDCHTKKHFEKLSPSWGKNIIHVSISTTIEQTLKENNIDSLIWKDFSLLDQSLFENLKKISSHHPPNCIYIYNGLYGKKYRESFFRKDIYNEVMEELVTKHNFTSAQFILSNTLHKPYEEMPQLYSKCFIGLRLCDKDGNANTVQEFEYLNIPIIHNCSDYGLKWSTKNDIIKIILHHNQTQC